MQLNKTKIIIFLHFFIWIGFFFVFWSHAYKNSPAGVTSESLATWADGAAHLTYSSFIANREGVPSSLPVYAGAPFIYPFAADSLTSLLIKLNLNIFTAYALVGFSLSTFLIYLLFSFYRSIFSKITTAIIASNLFLFSGGLGFVRLISNCLTQGIKILSQLPHEYTRMDDVHIFWINVISGELIPQRAFLLALPLGLFALWVFWRLFHLKPPSPFNLILAGVILGLLPIIHPHTLIVFTIIGVWVFINSLKNRDLLKSWILILIPGIIIGLPLIYRLITYTSHTSFFKYSPGWLASGIHMNWLWFWFINLGLFFPLAIIGWFKLTRPQKKFSIPFILVFVASNLFLFQPYDWDNSKLITWVHLFFAGVIASWLVTMFRPPLIRKSVITICFVVTILSGAIDVIRQLQPVSSVLMYNPEDLQLATFIKTHTPRDTIFLTSDSHVHPIPSLSGRQVIMGYRGWLWSYGINYQSRETNITAIFRGEPQTEALISGLDPDYLIIGPSEIYDWDANQTYFLNHYPLVYQSKNYKLFKIK
jgi:hypothetical protein